MANKKFDTLMQMAGKNQQKRESDIRESEVSATTNNVKGGGEAAPAEEEKITPEKKKQTSTAKKETRGRKPRAGVPDAERPSAERGCKEGYERHGYVLPSDVVSQIKNLAKYFNMTESAVSELFLQQGIKAAIKKHGEACVEEQRVGGLLG